LIRAETTVEQKIKTIIFTESNVVRPPTRAAGARRGPTTASQRDAHWGRTHQQGSRWS
jgi:hypothetical protein